MSRTLRLERSVYSIREVSTCLVGAARRCGMSAGTEGVQPAQRPGPRSFLLPSAWRGVLSGLTSFSLGRRCWMLAVERLARGRLHYGWIIAAVTFVTLLSAAGMRSTPGVLIIPLEKEFGWSRAMISVALSVNLLLYGVMGPFAAAFMDRFGVRRVMLISLGLVAAGVGLTTTMHTSWQLVLLWGIVVGLGTGSIALVLGAYIANRWFVERRGLVMGLLTASTATGQLIFLPTLASLVVGHGWRAAVILVAGVEDHSRSEEHTSELQSLAYLVCRLLLEKKKKNKHTESECESGPRHTLWYLRTLDQQQGRTRQLILPTDRVPAVNYRSQNLELHERRGCV